MSSCQNIIIGAAKKVLIADIGQTKAQAVDLGTTNGGVTVSVESSKTDVYVDQSVVALRGVINQKTYKATIPLAEVTLANLKLALGGTIDVTGKILTLGAETEKYHQIWIETVGPLSSTGVPTNRVYYFERVGLSGNASLVMNRTDPQSVTLEATVYACPDEDGEINIATITESDPV